MNNENGKRKIPTLFSHIAHNRNDGDDDDDDEDQVLKTIFSVSLACLLAQPLMAMAQNIESNVVAAFWSLMSIKDIKAIFPLGFQTYICMQAEKDLGESKLFLIRKIS